MDKKNKNGLITVLIIGGLAYLAYKQLGKKKDKRFYAEQIINTGYFSTGITTLLSFDEPFLKAWAASAKKGDTNFEYGGKTYNTQGGKQVK